MVSRETTKVKRLQFRPPRASIGANCQLVGEIMTSLLEAALAYASERGWAVFPCRSDKTPYTQHGVLDASSNPEQIKKWWREWPKANIGLDVGSAGLMVLDLDPGADREALARAVDGLPPTLLRARTPRGGEHLFYALADGERVPPSASKVAEHVDVRSFHSYVLLAPSRTADGAYTWESNGKPAYRTDEMVRMASVAREKHRDRDTWLIEPDLPENIGLAVEWLKTKAKVAVAGHGGDHMAYATAAHMKSFGISQELAFDLMWEHWNPRCVPPWSPDQVDHLETKVRNGYSYNTSPPGNLTPAYRVAKGRSLFKPVLSDLVAGREMTAGRFRFVDREGMESISPPEWLIPDLLPSGAYALLVGASGTFKTFLALDIALSIATGVNFPWDGNWPKIGAAGPVLFSVGEGRPEFRKRVMAWEKRYWKGKHADGLVLADPVPLIQEDLNPYLDGALAMSESGYKLVVIDTVGRAMQEYASAFTKMVETLQRELGCTVLALHHTGHESNRARGSSVFPADADTVLVTERAEKEMTVALSMFKQKDATEWDKPKMIAMEKVDLVLGGRKMDSLVAVPAKESARAPESVRSAVAEVATTLVLDTAVAAVLQSNPAKAWTTKELSQMVAARDEIEVSSKTLENRQLVELREKKGTKAHACYDPATRRWKWKN